MISMEALSAIKSDPNDLTIRLRGGYEFSPNISVVGQSILPHSREGGGEYIGLGYTY